MAKTPKGSKQEEADGPDPRRILKGTNVELPAYVWEQAREFLNGNPDMRFRNMVMAGFRALGLKIDDQDLIAERKRGPAG